MAKQAAKTKRASCAGIFPIPSLIRAAAFDAVNVPAALAGRKWTCADYNCAAATQERLIRVCFSRPGEGADSRECFIRFQIAEGLEREGRLNLKTDFTRFNAYLDLHLAYLQQEAA